MGLVEEILAGKRLALARLLTLIENNDPRGWEALDALYPLTGKAHLVGITGAPGVGKSSLVNQIARALRHPQDGEPAKTVAIVAVDPTSPFTGGALLGDRVRMRDLSGDPGIFIRSMASRGALGGLAPTTAAVVQALDAAGFEIILIETVGAGQAEVEIARLAHTTLVVETPNGGDDIQAIKAGLLEIADILVINKADRPGADLTERALRSMLDLGQSLSHPWAVHHPADATAQESASAPTPAWRPPIVRTVATEGKGIPELVRALHEHATYLRQTNQWQAREQMRLKDVLDHMLQAALLARWQAGLPEGQYRVVLERLLAREISPHRALQALLEASPLPSQMAGRLTS